MAKTIARIKIEGVIQEEGETYNQKWLLETIKKITKDKNNVAMLLFIDSPGGGVYESDEVYLAIQKYKKETQRPVYAYFASLAASGGYYIGCSADKIIANRNTLTGSIGVIAGRFVDASELLKKYNVKVETIHAGKNKTMGSISEPVTDEQRAIMQAIADECYAQFTSIVAESRRLEREAVKALADGRIYTASQAKEAGLVDEIMPYDDALEFLKKTEFSDKKWEAEEKTFEVKKKKSIKKLLTGALSCTLNGMHISVARESANESLRFPAFYYEAPRL